ncbi:MAG: hypothetical protein VW455_12045, partial [Nitrospinota bacterium]
MINALERLKAAHETPELPDEMAALAFNAGKVSALFSSHPPLDERIAALKRLNLPSRPVG